MWQQTAPAERVLQHHQSLHHLLVRRCQGLTRLLTELLRKFGDCQLSWSQELEQES